MARRTSPEACAVQPLQLRAVQRRCVCMYDGFYIETHGSDAHPKARGFVSGSRCASHLLESSEFQVLNIIVCRSLRTMRCPSSSFASCKHSTAWNSPSMRSPLTHGLRPSGRVARAERLSRRLSPNALWRFSSRLVGLKATGLTCFHCLNSALPGRALDAIRRSILRGLNRRSRIARSLYCSVLWTLLSTR